MMENLVRKTELQNGIKIVTKSMPHVRSVSMGVWVNVGARDEPLKTTACATLLSTWFLRGQKDGVPSR